MSDGLTDARRAMDGDDEGFEIIVKICGDCPFHQMTQRMRYGCRHPPGTYDDAFEVQGTALPPNKCPLKKGAYTVRLTEEIP